MIGFAHPPVLLLLLPPAALLAWRLRRGLARPRVRFSETEHLAEIEPSGRARFSAWLVPARGLALVLAVVALARPQAGFVEERIAQEGIDIVVALDISSSMLAEDFQPRNRLEVAKSVVRAFVAGREGDRIGLVVFAARGLTKSPLVLDARIVVGLVDEVQVGELEDGTAIGTAIATSLNRLKAGTGESRVLVLVTDGVNNRGEIDPLSAARLAPTLGVRIHTIGVGTQGTAPYPTTDLFGRKRYQQMEVEIDEETLTEIADLTGGRYFRATDETGLARIFEEIDALEVSPAEVVQTVRHRELFALFLVPALLLVIIGDVLGRSWLRVGP